MERGLGWEAPISPCVSGVFWIKGAWSSSLKGLTSTLHAQNETGEGDPLLPVAGWVLLSSFFSQWHDQVWFYRGKNKSLQRRDGNFCLPHGLMKEKRKETLNSRVNDAFGQTICSSRHSPGSTCDKSPLAGSARCINFFLHASLSAKVLCSLYRRPEDCPQWWSKQSPLPASVTAAQNAILYLSSK